MKVRHFLILLLTFALSCFDDTCDNSMTSPSPTVLSAPTTDGDDILEDDYMRADTEVDFHQVVGVTSFALAMRDETYIHGFIQYVVSYGYDVLRVFGKTDGWGKGKNSRWLQQTIGPMATRWLPAGPPMGGGAEQNLKRLLRVAAQYPNLWVEVVSCATERDNHDECTQWSRKVANIAKPYKNVFISAMNEPQMSNWTNGELNELMRILRQSGRPVGIDQPAEGGHWRFPRDLQVDFQAMHPRRNLVPGVHTLTLPELRNVIALNGLTLFDETNCYLSDWEADTYGLRNNSLFYLNGTGTEEQRQRAAEEDMEMYRKVRDAKWYFHSIATIMCESLDFYLPRWM